MKFYSLTIVAAAMLSTNAYAVVCKDPSSGANVSFSDRTTCPSGWSPVGSGSTSNTTSSVDCTQADIFKQYPNLCKTKLTGAFNTDPKGDSYVALNKACVGAGIQGCNLGQPAAGTAQQGAKVYNTNQGFSITRNTDGSFVINNGGSLQRKQGEYISLSTDTIDKYGLNDSQVQEIENQLNRDKGRLSAPYSAAIKNAQKTGSYDGQTGGFAKEYKGLKDEYGNKVTGEKNLNVTASERLKGSSDAYDKARAAAKKDWQTYNRNKDPSKSQELLDKAKRSQVEADNSKTKFKQDKSDSKSADRKVARLKEAEAIKHENTDGNFGGRYGGANTQVTEMVVNKGGEMIRSTAEQMLAKSSNDRNIREGAALAAKGMTASQADAMTASAKMALNSAKALGKQANTTSLVGYAQLVRGAQHFYSKKKVEGAAKVGQEEADYNENLANTKLSQAEALEKTQDPASLERALVLRKEAGKLAADANYWRQNIEQNEAGEKNAQNMAAAQQALVGYQTMQRAQQLRNEKATAEMLAMQAQAAAGNGGGFTFNPGSGPQPNTPGDNPNGDPNNNGQVTNVDTGEQGIAADGDLMNPGINDGGFEAPQAGQFVAGKQDGGGGGGSGGGMGGTSGTSAAKDDGKGGGEAPGKNQAGGAFASGDGGGSGSRFSRPGGGGSGADSNWLEMMKKFLPGGDEVAKHEEERVDLTDRSLASDQPSVLGRNKNIFEEISKKYQKKNNEGAIVFTGDRT